VSLRRGWGPGVAGPVLSFLKGTPVSTTKRLQNIVAKYIDVEMFQKGWLMLCLILGTIGVLFTICCVMVFRHS